jgi:hypothetical protein
MSIVEKRSAAHGVDYVVEERHMCATTRIYVGLVVALAIYVLGLAVLLQNPRSLTRLLGRRADP